MMRRRQFMAASATLLFFGVILLRLGWLQLVRHEALSERAERARDRHVIAQDSRGAIFDRSGALLAVSIQGGACFADPLRLRSPREAARALAPLLKIEESTLISKLQQKKRFVWLARRLDPTTAEAVRALKMPGLVVLAERKRFYPEEQLAAHVLGVVNEDQQGLSGIERAADLWLRNRGTPSLFRDWEPARRVSDETITRRDLPDHSIVLTLDRTLQMICEQELLRQLKLSRAKSGTVVVQDPANGEILAMASAPSFNPNWWGTPLAPADYGPELLKNPAVEHVFEPGSTYKIVTAAAALEERKVSREESIFCEYGRWRVAGRFIKDHEKDGWLSFDDVIGHSSNIGTAKVASRLGAPALYRYSRAFGFGIPTGCGLPGDGSGILRQTTQWSGASLETIAFGQEVAVTALQMVNAYSALANGGTLQEARLFRGVIDEAGDYRQWRTPQPVRQVISARTAADLRRVLRHVVESGTGKGAEVPGLYAAGKTGTAQKINPETRQYDSERYIASFCGFAPAENPRLVIGVFLDEPQVSIWGGAEAAPLFARILRAAATYLKMDPRPLGPLAISRTVTRT